MSEMDNVVQVNAASLEETASAAEELPSLGSELEPMVNTHWAIFGGQTNAYNSYKNPSFKDLDDGEEDHSIHSKSSGHYLNDTKRVVIPQPQKNDEFSGI